MASLSSHNPFRTPTVSPSPTGQSSTQQYAPPSGPPPRHPQQQQFAPPSTPRPPQQQYAPPPNPPPSNSSSSPPRTAQQQYAPPLNPPPSNPSPPTLSPDPTGLTDDDELPPAYTTRPDVYSGESTLEYGPARPFQPVHQPAPRPPQPQAQPQSPIQSLWQQLTGQFTGSNTTQFPPAHWSAYPGGQQQQRQYAPPPNPPANPQQQPQPPTTHLSEFARDFYATTTVPPGAFSDVSGARNNSSSDPGYPPPQPYHAPPGAPPRTPSPARSPGGLPRRRPPHEHARPGPPPTPQRQHAHLPAVPRVPQVCVPLSLVPSFPLSFAICNNTGYKRGDPSRPCHRCWTRYARPYVAASSAFPQAQRQRPPPAALLALLARILGAVFVSVVVGGVPRCDPRARRLRVVAARVPAPLPLPVPADAGAAGARIRAGRPAHRGDAVLACVSWCWAGVSVGWLAGLGWARMGWAVLCCLRVVCPVRMVCGGVWRDGAGGVRGGLWAGREERAGQQRLRLRRTGGRGRGRAPGDDGHRDGYGKEKIRPRLDVNPSFAKGTYTSVPSPFPSPGHSHVLCMCILTQSSVFPPHTNPPPIPHLPYSFAFLPRYGYRY
ncbi:hypothetical protein MSAN_00614600 [Mycena sanguinolenta]|uniref:Uncharacterized protein n=1 Tax=Mycena sanguinolenta TaxID=230812 RepID=A0A8H6Z3V5_9AGAR|nr:hypothetical protein MSAN_00614600 [Mycena sanguinolenta]